VNHLYRTSRNGIRYKTPQGKEWQNVTAAVMAAAKTNRRPYSGDVALEIVFRTADRRRWDLDNRVKALQDCLAMAGVIEDDRQIQRLHVERQAAAQTATSVVVLELGAGRAKA
jgi:Holliday junction resolvase RusA-like endonuclease